MVLASEIVAVYADAVPPLDDVNRQVLHFVEVYEHNGSGGYSRILLLST